jgi:uncharacterized membrane protein YedE/YeeE
MKFFLNLLLGVTFGLGLILSNIYKPATITSFLSWNKSWVPSFLYTIVGMILAVPIVLLFTKKFNLFEAHLINTNEQTALNTKVIIGSILFGIGWSVSGLCVSTAAINLVFGEWQSALFFCFMILGFYCPQFFKKLTL